MKRFGANTAHNSCSKAGFSVLGHQSKCLGSIRQRHAARSRVTFVLLNSTGKVLKTLRQDDSHCNVCCCGLPTSFPPPPTDCPALCNTCSGGFEINTIYFFLDSDISWIMSNVAFILLVPRLTLTYRADMLLHCDIYTSIRHFRFPFRVLIIQQVYLTAPVLPDRVHVTFCNGLLFVVS